MTADDRAWLRMLTAPIVTDWSAVGGPMANTFGLMDPDQPGFCDIDYMRFQLDPEHPGIDGALDRVGKEIRRRNGCTT